MVRKERGECDHAIGKREEEEKGEKGGEGGGKEASPGTPASTTKLLPSVTALRTVIS
jgi:hypothetical protein